MAKRPPISLNDQLADEFTSHAVDLLRFTETAREDVLNNLVDLQNELVQRLRGAGLNVPRTDWQKTRLEKLLQQTKATIASAYRDSASVLDNHLLDLADITSQRTTKLLTDAFGDELPSVAMTPGDLSSLVDDTLIQGAPAEDWWAKQEADTTHRFATQMRLGLGQGETVDALSDRATDALGVSQNQADTLVRTSANSVGNAVNNSVFDDNDDILRGKQLIVTLDGRTSDICMARSNACWDMEGNPLPESPIKIPFPGPPPFHHNCRSLLVPLTRSWAELSGMDLPGGDDLDPTTRASMDGTVAGNPSYEEWLLTKSEAFQRDVLGPGKYDIWKRGNLGLAQMVDQSGNSLTLAQLRKKAGLDS